MLAPHFQTELPEDKPIKLWYTYIQEKGHGASCPPRQQRSSSWLHFFWNIRKKERFHNTTMVLLGAFLLEMLQLPHVHHFL